MESLMQQELRVYKENPERYSWMIKAISELKTTGDKESYLSSKRKLITEKMTEEEYNKNFG
jgi:hypothetical protein|nr:MAG TPA: hypothetical protein [Caudoviricetes sp.]